MLFLLQAEQMGNALYPLDTQHDGCTIHWSQENDSTWILNNRGMVYHFELPREIYYQWLRSEGKQRQQALQIKRAYFSKIVLFNRSETDDPEVQVIKLSENFMKRAENSLEND